MQLIKNLVLILGLMLITVSAKAESGFLESITEMLNKETPQVAKVDSKNKKAKRVKKKVKKVADKIIPKGPKKHKVMFGIGQLFLFSDFSEKGNDKITSDLEYIYMSQEKFDVTLNTHFFSTERRNQDIHVWAVAPSIKYNLYKKESVTFYGKGAFGFYNIEVEDSKWVFGTNLGTGVEVDLNDKYVVGMKWDYHMPFEVRYSDGTEVDGSYMRLLIQMGLKF